MTLGEEVFAIRNSAALSRPAHVAVVRVDGADALDFLQTATTQSPYVREGRVRHTLFLRDDASVLADAFVVNVDDGYLVLAEGPDEAGLVAWLTTLRDRSAKKQVAIHAMGSEWAAFGVDGPYAWEVMAGLLGPAVLGMPYLTLHRRDEMLCVRAGKTGEYGYLLLAPRALEAEIEAKLGEIGKPLDLALASLAALDVCALEGWHFSMRTLRETSIVSPLTPIELQLQWRVVYTREFVGADALRARRAEGLKARATCFTSEEAIEPGQRVALDGREVGEVLAACASPTLGKVVGSVLLDAKLAHPHITFSAGAATLRTSTASLVYNQSLRVQPHKHSYATRDTVTA